MELAGRRVAILADSMFEDLELWYPLLRLREAGAEVFVVGSESDDEVTGLHGFTVKPDTEAEMVDAAQFDAIVVPGGYAPDHLRRSAAVVRLVRQAALQGRVVAAIGHGASLLVSANVVASRTMTCHRAVRDDVTNAGASVLDRDVVRDGNLLTARAPGDLPAFGRLLVQAIAELPMRHGSAR